MNTAMGRFVLLSISFHAAMLAAVNHSSLPPAESLQSTLTVMLPETPRMPVRTDHPPAKHVPIARHTSAPIVKTISPSQPKAAAAKTSRPGASNVVPTVEQQISNKIEHDSGMRTKPPSTSIASKAPNHSDGGIHSATPTKSMKAPTQQLDTARLTSQLDHQVRNALAPYFAYPMIARRHGWQGKVEVGLRVEANGRLSHMRIARSSGYRLLDAAALAALHHVDAIPRAAGWLDGHHFDMVLAIDYRLLDDQS